MNAWQYLRAESPLTSGNAWQHLIASIAGGGAGINIVLAGKYSAEHINQLDAATVNRHTARINRQRQKAFDLAAAHAKQLTTTTAKRVCP